MLYKTYSGAPASNDKNHANTQYYWKTMVKDGDTKHITLFWLFERENTLEAL